MPARVSRSGSDVRETLLEGAFRYAALVGRGGHQDRDRVVHAFRFVS
jgi:hypothetical protein